MMSENIMKDRERKGKDRMEYYIDITTEMFEQIQNHEVHAVCLPKHLFRAEPKTGDTMKLYHPANPEEALRVEIQNVEEAEEEGAGAGWKLELALLEWVFRIETELDELLREEKRWLEGLE